MSKSNKRPKIRIGLILSYVVLVALVIIALYPIVWIFAASFREGTSLYSTELFPRKVTLDHYYELFTSKEYMYTRWYTNTLQVAFLTMIFTTTIVTISGYVLSRFRFGMRKTLLSSILILGMFPSFMSLTAIYVMLVQLKLYDNLYALVGIYSAGALMGSFQVKGFFDTIPKSLEESAKLDGASNFQVMRLIMLPLSKPLLVFIALTSFTGAWTDFILARLLIQTPEKQTLAVGLYDLVSTVQTSNASLFATGAVLIAIPITVLFIVLQKYLVSGMMAGAEKG
jgi:arabinogalactan oligomer / maltooligosaccharide transport system permease protein